MFNTKNCWCLEAVLRVCTFLGGACAKTHVLHLPLKAAELSCGAAGAAVDPKLLKLDRGPIACTKILQIDLLIQLQALKVYLLHP